MRIPIVVLLLAVCTISGDFFSIKHGAAMQNAMDRIKAELNVTALHATREKLFNGMQNVKAKLPLPLPRGAEQRRKPKNLIPVENRVQEDNYSNTSDDDENVNRTKRQAFLDSNYPNNIWLDGVDYFFDNSTTPQIRSVFVEAARQWMSQTCIDFRENPAAFHVINVIKGEGCWSSAGKVISGEQILSLGEGCDSVGKAAHEIGHAIGLLHTHVRHDRDLYVTYYPENVIPNISFVAFQKHTIETNENYGIPYDYGSIMHYGSTSFSMNGRPTMLPRDSKYVETMGSPFISFYDLLMINTHYGCYKKCRLSFAKCKMGGFPNPRDCSKCICPSGYGGRLCDKRPPGCGKLLQASWKPQILRELIGDGKQLYQPSEPHMDYQFCNYWITAPKGSRIEIKIKGLEQGDAVEGCAHWGVEIKTHQDQLLTGYRFCSPNDAGISLVSNYSVVPVIAYVYKGIYAKEFAIEYQIV